MSVAVVADVLGESRKSLEGLTLVELMVVLVVMGALMSAALPSVADSFADRRVSMVARDVVAVFRRARYMSMAYGRAHRVEYDNDFGAGLTDQVFAFETLRGTAGACSLSTFENPTGRELEDLDCDLNWRCVDSLYADNYDSDVNDDDFVRVDGWGQTAFCYEAGANNQVYRNNILFSNWSNPNAQSGFGFVVFRELDGNLMGVARKVYIPFGTGSPRVLR